MNVAVSYRPKGLHNLGLGVGICREIRLHCFDHNFRFKCQSYIAVNTSFHVTGIVKLMLNGDLEVELGTHL